MTEQPLEDDMPVDPDAQEYDDSDEGADDAGVPVKSVYGSEEKADDVPEAAAE
jgi:hypothetical protein